MELIMLLNDKYAKSILNVLYNTGPLTRKQINKLLKMRLNSLVDICNQLVKEEYILHQDACKTRNIPLMLNPKRFAAIGAEHTKDLLRCILLDVRGEKISAATFPLNPLLGGQERLSRIVELLTKFRQLQQDCEICALGFADVGIVNTEMGTGVYSVHVPDWENIPVRKVLEQEIGLFTSIVDRSGASALDYLRTNPDNEKVKNSLQIFVGNGIGASILQNGRYWGADTPSSCQLGHTIAVPDGELCHCGNRGCVETLATIPAVLHRIDALSKGKIKDKEIFLRKVSDGDRLCELVLREAGMALGVAISNVVTFTAITNVTIRSELCKYSTVFFDAIRETVAKNVIYPFSRNVQISVSTQDEDCSAMGAAFYAQQNYFSIDKGFKVFK
mgnify:CR=1 FL=1